MDGATYFDLGPHLREQCVHVDGPALECDESMHGFGFVWSENRVFCLRCGVSVGQVDGMGIDDHSSPWPSEIMARAITVSLSPDLLQGLQHAEKAIDKLGLHAQIGQVFLYGRLVAALREGLSPAHALGAALSMINPEVIGQILASLLLAMIRQELQAAEQAGALE